MCSEKVIVLDNNVTVGIVLSKWNYWLGLGHIMLVFTHLHKHYWQHMSLFSLSLSLSLSLSFCHTYDRRNGVQTSKRLKQETSRDQKKKPNVPRNRIQLILIEKPDWKCTVSGAEGKTNSALSIQQYVLRPSVFVHYWVHSIMDNITNNGKLFARLSNSI